MDATRRRTLRTLLAAATTIAACNRMGARNGPARRVVTLGPSATEVLFALGEGARVVGVSRFDDYPPEVARLPRVGGLVDPSFEAIVALRPDAVLGARFPINRAVLERLESLGVRTLFPVMESLAQIREATRQFAALVGAPERAAPLLARVDARVEQVRSAVRGRAAPSVLVVLGQRPISVAGPGSYLDELVTLAGGRNVVRAGPHWPTLALEAVLALSPEVVVDLTGLEQQSSPGHVPLSQAWSAYAALPAVRDGRVARLDDPAVVRPGPRIGEAIAQLAAAIHPGVAV